MPLANPNQNPDEAEAPEQQQQALNRNSEDAAAAYRAYMMQSQFYQSVHAPLSTNPITPYGGHALTPMNLFGAPAAPADRNSEDISQLVTAMKISNDNIAGLTTAVSDVKIGLEKEGEARREGIKTVQNNVDRNTVRIDGNTARIDEHKGEIDQIKHHRAEDKAEVEQLKDKLVEEVTKRQALESKVEGLSTQLKEVATPAPKKKEVLWKCANSVRTISPRPSSKKPARTPTPANAKIPVASENKETGKSTPAATRSSTRLSSKKSTASAFLRKLTSPKKPAPAEANLEALLVLPSPGVDGAVLKEDSCLNGKKVVLKGCFDNVEGGKAGVVKMIADFGGQKRVKMPKKDANECEYLYLWILWFMFHVCCTRQQPLTISTLLSSIND